MDIRRVRFRLSGGFAGLVRGADVTGAELAPAERRGLEAHARKSLVSRDAGARDAQVYELDVTTADGECRLEFDDMTLPDDLAELVARLSARSTAVKP